MYYDFIFYVSWEKSWKRHFNLQITYILRSGQNKKIAKVSGFLTGHQIPSPILLGLLYRDNKLLLINYQIVISYTARSQFCTVRTVTVQFKKVWSVTFFRFGFFVFSIEKKLKWLTCLHVFINSNVLEINWQLRHRVESFATQFSSESFQSISF